MSSATQPSTGLTQPAGSADDELIASAIADIEGLCGHVFCESFYLRMNRDVMAIACERHPKVLDWWKTMIRLGHPKAPSVWAEIKARMDARAAARALDEVSQLRAE